MVFHKRISCSASGHHVPVTPSVPKCAKGKRSSRKKIELNEMCAFDMLATIAGKLLTEGENSLLLTDTNLMAVKETLIPEAMKSDPLDQDSCNESQAPVNEVPDSPELYSRMESGVKSLPLVSSDSSAEMPDKTQIAWTDVVDRECEDNSSACTHPDAFRTHKVSKKAHSTKYKKAGPPRVHDGDENYSDCEMKPAFRNSNLFYTRQRTQFKRKKQFDHSSIFTREVKREASSSKIQKPMYESKDKVKLCIKSFQIPELLIEIPETATVGSLKKKVLEAMAAMLGEGLHVGVTVHGKKVQDDAASLVQAGINPGKKTDNIDFSIEPKFVSELNQSNNSCQNVVQEDSHVTDLGDLTEPLARISPPTSPPENQASDPEPVLNLVQNPVQSPSLNCHESGYDSAPSPNSPIENLSSPEKNSNSMNETKTMVVHKMEMEEALAVVVPSRKSKRVEPVGQRRIRRPFSVAEVEALVQAVEKLGTGRWRDVKVNAFDNAKHRTYVDLKDKWKTLVHTASIAPQQRRGEPVPQDLLDRVLAAQAYWSHQQAKLQLKSEACLLT
ncbi:hypothetical protein LUZ61_003092 [Rhynchospora tenuis]|uniref:Uncharacterized protein n=1 Tax=Rhynchospora tenuis TaxID=198213 RepID=A0AAD6ESC7_9POAL|nr:hypothetical protein LUZ61_003092 [Rhynchospora tenuis]